MDKGLTGFNTYRTFFWLDFKRAKTKQSPGKRKQIASLGGKAKAAKTGKHRS